ncbi:MAG: GH3 [uncultured Sphingomonadaceae bacterium]|uniref:beta-N-acetylhexosaminidase n=1 Tax=uncultured Sphingomonadaceae bacterium TaxID=169976 RepID=A0A6J4T407_9SPHN|nr:MAG: GH3 [uncultured Sphingomonadaceae bacterium]
MLAAIYGLSGPTLTDSERAFFRDADPAGYILFARNIVDKDQLRALTADLRSLHGRDDLPILIDQEGGRVARMRPPVWPAFPAPGAPFDRLYEIAPMSAIEAMRANAESLALMLHEVGISVNCLPLLDVRQPGAHDIIGDRSFGSDPMRVAALGRATLDGLAAGGCVGVVKHMPGHGRATSDSHLELPVVNATDEELAIDLEPFAKLRDAPMGMTAHVVYTAWDADAPATMSSHVIDAIIRRRIGFDGLLMSDDIDMKALSGTPGEKAATAVGAGCDVALDCWGRIDDMIDIANNVGDLTAKGVDRLAAAMATAKVPDPARVADLVAKRDALLALA